MGQTRPLFVYYLFFWKTNFTEKTVDFSGIRTRIDRVEGKHADHCTTTKAQSVLFSYLDVKVIFLAHVILKSLSYLSWLFLPYNLEISGD